jgi:hypothetical protein
MSNPADPAQYTYTSPLAGYENAPPLPDERATDGKSYGELKKTRNGPISAEIIAYHLWVFF